MLGSRTLKCYYKLLRNKKHVAGLLYFAAVNSHRCIYNNFNFPNKCTQTIEYLYCLLNITNNLLIFTITKKRTTNTITVHTTTVSLYNLHCYKFRHFYYNQKTHNQYHNSKYHNSLSVQSTLLYVSTILL